MQARHQSPARYFEEQAASCRDFYLPFLAARTDLKFGAGCCVLEVGCGLGGILSAFAELGCDVTGVDISRRAIDSARELAAAAAASRATQHFAHVSSCESPAGGGGVLVAALCARTRSISTRAASFST